MSINNSDDYTVGYGKPPKATQFKKGESGNPNGRPKGTRNIATLLDEALNSRITVRDGDAIRSMSAIDAMIQSLIVQAVKGDHKAIQLVIKLMEQHKVMEPPPPEQPQTGVLVVHNPISMDMWNTLFGPDDERREAVERLIERLNIEDELAAERANAERAQIAAGLPPPGKRQ